MNKVTALEFYSKLMADSIEATEFNLSHVGTGSEWLQGAIIWIRVAKMNLREVERLMRQGGAR